MSFANALNVLRPTLPYYVALTKYGLLRLTRDCFEFHPHQAAPPVALEMAKAVFTMGASSCTESYVMSRTLAEGPKVEGAGIHHNPTPAGDGRRGGRLAGRLAQVPGQSAVGGRRWRLRKAPLPLGRQGLGRHRGQPAAPGRRLVERARAAAPQGPEEERPQAHLRQGAAQPG